MANNSELLLFAENLARHAGDHTLTYFGSEIAVELKSDESPVTVADRETEALIREAIERQYPEHGILGEEEGTTRPGAAFQWIIDPIDGTKSFIRGVPLYGVMIALEENGQSRLGVVFHPALNLMISAEVGAGTHLNGRRVQVRDARSAGETCIVASGFAQLLRERPEFYRELVQHFPLQRTWGDCYGYTLVASGRAQAMIDPEMNRWDLAAVKPIIEEAGGVFTDMEGINTASGKSCLAATPKVHAKILSLLGY